MAVTGYFFSGSPLCQSVFQIFADRPVNGDSRVLISLFSTMWPFLNFHPIRWPLLVTSKVSQIRSLIRLTKFSYEMGFLFQEGSLVAAGTVGVRGSLWL